MSWAMIVVAGASLVSGAIASGSANKKANEEQREADQLERDIKAFEASRPVSYTHLTLPTTPYV